MMNKKSVQQGVTLIVALVILVLGSIVVLSSMRGTLTQQKMTHSQNLQAISFMSAETGSSRLANTIECDGLDAQGNIKLKHEVSTDPENPTLIPQPDNEEIGQENLDAYFYAEDITSEEELLQKNPEIRVFMVTGQVKDPGRSTHSVAKIRVKFEVDCGGQGEALDTVWKDNMKEIADRLTDIDVHTVASDVKLGSNPTLVGNFHSNGDIKIGGSKSNSSLEGSLTTADTCPNNIPLECSTRDRIATPSPDSFINDYVEKYGDLEECEPTCPPSSDCKGKIFYCNGTVNISDTLKNAIIIADGNIEMTGKSVGFPPGTDQKPSVALVAKGNITIGGSSEKAAIFWAGGTMTQNGESILRGQIVAEKIEFNGKVTITGVFGSSFQPPDVPVGPTPPPDGGRITIKSWSAL
ncbi:MAG: hypothetical protein EOM20_16845 [Spartobacteria bacterium]|nr:hypothetical protein [Spartobacteria bacterium]